MHDIRYENLFAIVAKININRILLSLVASSLWLRTKSVWYLKCILTWRLRENGVYGDSTKLWFHDQKGVLIKEILIYNKALCSSMLKHDWEDSQK